jgi:hypothetical protein
MENMGRSRQLVVKYPVGPVGMTVTYGEDGVTVDMRKYIKTMIEEFSIDLGDSSASSPAADDLFLIGSSKKVYLPVNVQGPIFKLQLLSFVCV